MSELGRSQTTCTHISLCGWHSDRYSLAVTTTSLISFLADLCPFHAFLQPFRDHVTNPMICPVASRGDRCWLAVPPYPTVNRKSSSCYLECTGMGVQTTMWVYKIQCGRPNYNVGVQTTMWVSKLQCECPNYNVGVQTTIWVEEWKTNLMSLAILFHFLCTQHVSDINIFILRSLRLCCWITISVVLFSVRCVLEIWCGWFWVVFVLQAAAWEQDDRCGNSTTQSQAPEDGYINVRNMLST